LEIRESEDLAVISCETAMEQYKKDCHARLDDLRKKSGGGFTVEVGDEVLFPLTADEDENLWAGPPVVTKNREFIGKVDRWSGHYGFVSCAELDEHFPRGVYLHGKVATKAEVDTTIGNRVKFNLHISKSGSAQASSPKNASGVKRKGSGKDGSAAKKGKTEYGVADAGWGKGYVDAGWGEGWAGGKDKSYAKAYAKGFEKAAKAKDPAWAKGWAKGLEKAGGGKWGGKGGGKWGGKGAGDDSGEFFEGYLTRYAKEKGFGFISGSAAGEDVYIHTNVAESAGAYNGVRLQFKVHYSAAGKPQASAPVYAVYGESAEWFEGYLTRYTKEKGFGFISGSVGIGEDVYMHTTVVEKAGAYEGAKIGFKVHYSATTGKPQASTPAFVIPE